MIDPRRTATPTTPREEVIRTLEHRILTVKARGRRQPDTRRQAPVHRAQCQAIRREPRRKVTQRDMHRRRPTLMRWLIINTTARIHRRDMRLAILDMGRHQVTDQRQDIRMVRGLPAEGPLPRGKIGMVATRMAVGVTT